MLFYFRRRRVRFHPVFHELIGVNWDHLPFPQSLASTSLRRSLLKIQISIITDHLATMNQWPIPTGNGSQQSRRMKMVMPILCHFHLVTVHDQPYLPNRVIKGSTLSFTHPIFLTPTDGEVAVVKGTRIQNLLSHHRRLATVQFCNCQKPIRHRCHQRNLREPPAAWMIAMTVRLRQSLKPWTTWKKKLISRLRHHHLSTRAGIMCHVKIYWILHAIDPIRKELAVQLKEQILTRFVRSKFDLDKSFNDKLC